LQAFFHEKDYLNHRYHVKRALFLGGIAKALEANCSAFESFELVPFKGDVRKPILVLTPGEAPIYPLVHTISSIGWVCEGWSQAAWSGSSDDAIKSSIYLRSKSESCLSPEWSAANHGDRRVSESHHHEGEKQHCACTLLFGSVRKRQVEWG
jgi:hypothetical protein